jgi:hypothetical protein
LREIPLKDVNKMAAMGRRKYAAEAFVAVVLMDYVEQRKKSGTREWLLRRKEKGAFNNVIR